MNILEFIVEIIHYTAWPVVVRWGMPISTNRAISSEIEEGIARSQAGPIVTLLWHWNAYMFQSCQHCFY